MPVKIVPGFDVHDTVLPDIYDEILLRAQKAEMIALDLEFSGFPTRSPDDLYSRYEEWSKTAKTHAVLSLGMTLVSQGKVSNFDFLMRNEEPHLINPYNVSFLAREGFDFNKQLTHGIPYKPGRLDTSKIRLAKHSIVETAEEELADEKAKTIRTLVIEIFVIMRMKKIPLVLHNGFMDLLYLYQHFITDLPDKFECFVYDINAIFPGGIYDTKYMAERKIGEKKHYLPYLYVKHQYTEQAPALQVEDTICIDKKQPKNESQKENYNDNNKKEASNRRVAAKAGRKRSRDNDDDEEQALEKNNKKQRHASGICEYFALHGFCTRQATGCKYSHDIQHIVERDLNISAWEQSQTVPQSKDVKKNDTIVQEDERTKKGILASIWGYLRSSMIEQTSVVEDKQQQVSGSKQLIINATKDESRGAHAAYFDAFMTAYIFHGMKQRLSSQDLQSCRNQMRFGRQLLELKPRNNSRMSPSMKQLIDFMDASQNCEV